MAKAYDATLKGILEDSPGDWPVLLGLPRAEARVIDADVSTFSGAADKVLRIRATPDWILHLEFQAGPDESLPRRLQTANVLLDHRHGLLVRSVAVLLHPRANRSNLTGVYERRFEGRDAHLTFRYDVLRVWQTPPEVFLTGGIGLLPLAPISAVHDADVPAVIARMKERLSRFDALPEASRLWTAAHILMGMRFTPSVAETLLEGVMDLEQYSSTYQAIVRKGLKQGREQGREQGRLEQARKILLVLGADRFGEPSARIMAEIEGVADPDRLQEMTRRVLHSSGWEELLQAPGGTSRPKRRKPKA